MPEGPEVYLLKKMLNRNYKNSILKEVKIISGRYKRHGYPKGYYNFKGDLPVKITSFHNIGKFLWIETNTNWTIWITLGLTGWIQETSKNDNKSVRIEFKTSKGNLFMVDSRNFGTITFSENGDLLDKKINKLGFDPLNEKVSLRNFTEILLHYGSDKILADALLDQRIIAGIGNYLRAEIIYHAKLDPFIKVKNMTSQEINQLLKSIKYIKNKFLKPHASHSVYRQEYTPLGEKVYVDKTPKDRSFYWISRKK